MPKKLLSLLTVLAFVFSLIRIMPVRAEEYVEAKADKITSGVSESRMINGLTEEDWLRIMEEQEKLMTPEIRASIRENAMKSLEGKNFKNGDFAMKNAKPSDYGFKTQAELDKWLAMPFDPMKISTPSGFSISPEEYALKVGASFTVNAYGYTNANALQWFGAGDSCISVSASGSSAFVTGTAPGSAFAVVTDHAQSPIAQLGCAVEVISFDVGVTELYLSNGDTYQFNVSTSYSNPSTEIQILNPTGGIALTSGIGASDSSITVYDAQGSFDAIAYIYLTDRPTVGCAVTLHIVNDPITITVDPPVAEVYVGETTTLTAAVTGTTNSVYWEGSNDLFTIGRNTGIIRGLLPGNGISVATIDGTDIQKGILTNIYGINSISSSNVTLLKGGQYQLTYNAYIPDGAQVLYGTNDASIANMQYDGTITGVSAGTTSVGVWVRNHNSTLKWCNVTVLEPEITISNPGTIDNGTTGTFSATVAGNYPLVWSSSNSNIIRIDNASTGKYTALGTGTVTVTATIENSTVSQSIELNVRTGLITDSIEFEQHEVTIEVTESFIPQIKRKYPSGLTPIYSTFDDDIISINGNTITGIAVGDATLTVNYGESTDYMFIKVINSRRNIAWDTDDDQPPIVEMECYNDSTRSYTRVAKIYKAGTKEPADGTVVYSSSNPAVATVNGFGTVSAISNGSAIITAEIYNTQISVSYTVNVSGPTESSGAAFYRVPFKDIGYWSEEIPKWESALRNIYGNQSESLLGVYNGTIIPGQKFYGMDKSSFCWALATSKIFYFETHGTNDSLRISSDGNRDPYITADDIRNYYHIPVNGTSAELSNTNLVILAACRSGVGSFGSAIRAASPKIVITMNDDINGLQLKDSTNFLIGKLFAYDSIGTIKAYLNDPAYNDGKDLSFLNIDHGAFGSWTINDIINN